mgnify:CR=1 FL=1
MEYWQVISWCETDHIVEVAQHAEKLGFTGLILAEHIYYPQETTSRYYYSEDGESVQNPEMEFPDPLISFAAAAAVTETLRFMTGIYVVPLRHPIELAKNLATLARLSDNRVHLGLGAGWLKEEFDQFGVDFSTRGARTDAMLKIMRRLWSGEAVSFEDAHFQLDKVQIRPLPEHPVPLVGGGHSAPALRRAVNLCDGWYGPGNTVEELENIVPKLYAMRAESPRATEPFRVIAPLLEPLNDRVLSRLEDIGVHATVNYPFLYGCGPGASLDEKKRYMDNFAEQFL